MFTVTTRARSLNKEDRSIPKSLVPFFFISQFCFGIDFGFAVYYKERLRYSATWISNGVTFVMMFVLFAPFRLLYDVYWFWFSFAEYVMYFIFLKTVKYTPCDLVIDLHYMLDEDSSHTRLGIVVLIYMFLMMTLKLTFGLLRCFYEDHIYCIRLSFAFYCVYFLPCLSLDVISVVQIIIFHCVYHKARKLKNKLRCKEISLSQVLRQYMDIADCYDRIKPLLNFFVILGLILGIPKLMSVTWYMLLHIKLDSWYSYTCEGLFAMHTTLQVLLPAVAAEMINAQTDGLKLTLSELIAVGEDDEWTSQASRILQYVKRRRLRHEVFRVVPLDIRLPVGLFSLCATYFIVLLQFTHLYD